MFSPYLMQQLMGVFLYFRVIDIVIMTCGLGITGLTFIRQQKFIQILAFCRAHAEFLNHFISDVL